MPIYEYACNSCNEKFEQLVRSMSSDTKIKCPRCPAGSDALDTLMARIAMNMGISFRAVFSAAARGPAWLVL